MPYTYELHCLLPATPAEVYEAWLSSEGHSEMTGADAEMSKDIGAEVSAWDGYISGRNVELIPAQKIVQTWRTTQFTEQHPDSTITVTLAPALEGCRLTLLHAGVPDGQTSYEKGGWQDFYFAPMKAYFHAKRDRQGTL